MLTISKDQMFDILFEGYKKHKHLRCGQAMYNKLHELNSDIAHEINGTEDDPFYNDDNIENFINKLLTMSYEHKSK